MPEPTEYSVKGIPEAFLRDLEANLDKLGNEGLHSIRHQVTRRLSARARAHLADPFLYNNHGSVHSNHSD